MKPALLVTVLALAGCGGQNPQIAVDGEWTYLEPPPGPRSRVDLELHQNGQAVTGSGQSAEQVRSGALQVTGSIAGRQLSLRFKPERGLPATYVARVEELNILRGTLTDANSSTENVVFVKNTGLACAMYCVAGAASCKFSDGRCVFSCNQCICESAGGRWSAGVPCP
jgi:hypothetical protein